MLQNKYEHSRKQRYIKTKRNYKKHINSLESYNVKEIQKNCTLIFIRLNERFKSWKKKRGKVALKSKEQLKNFILFQKVVLTNFFLKTRLLRAIELVRVLGMYILNNCTIFKEHKDLNKIIKGFQDENITTKSKVLNKKKCNILEFNIVSCKQSHASKQRQRKKETGNRKGLCTVLFIRFFIDSKCS